MKPELVRIIVAMVIGFMMLLVLHLSGFGFRMFLLPLIPRQ